MASAATTSDEFWRSPALPVLAALLCIIIVSAGPGCDLAGIPATETHDAALEDAGELDVSWECVPSDRRCLAGAAQICGDDGYWLEQSCPASTACDQGICKPVETECHPSTDTSGPSSFSVSKTALYFETNDDLKSTKADLDITNCGTSPITIADIDIEDPNALADNNVFPSVFKLEQESLLRGLELPPGESAKIIVRYQPRYALASSAGAQGKLDIDIRGPTFHSFSLNLIPKTHCVTATPARDLGMLEEGASRRIHVQNCGNQQLHVRGVRAEPDKPETISNVDLTLEGPTEGFSLARGESREFTYHLRALDAGEFDQRVIFDIENLETNPFTRITGRIVPRSCTQNTLEAPTVWTEEDDAAQTWYRQTELGQRVHFEMNPSPPWVGEPLFELQAPQGSRAHLELPSDAALTRGKMSFVPDVAGSYRVRMNYVDADERPMCQEKVLRVEAVPLSDLYVDLQWLTGGDPIAGDVGYGRGADLNLHLTATDDLLNSPPWGDPSQGCFGFGELPANTEEFRAPRTACSPGNSAQAEIRSLSVSGAHREIITVEQVSRRYYHIGVQAWSIMDYFGDATAQLTVYAYGEPVEAVEIEPAFWTAEDEAPPEDLDELLIVELGDKQFWSYGVWDAYENRLLPRPTRFFETLP